MASTMAPKRRPAAAEAPPRRRFRGVLARPAAAGIPAEVRLKLQDVSLANLANFEKVHLKDASYYHRAVELCGKIRGGRTEGSETFLEMEVTGVKDEELLRLLSGKKHPRLQVHACPAGCGNELSGADIIHAEFFDEVKGAPEDWMSNLVKVVEHVESEDENAKLRERHERRDKEEGRKKSPRVSKESKKKKKKKEKDGGGRGDSPPEDKGEEELETGQKALKALYGGTGLDPSSEKRAKILSKARKLGQKSKKKKGKKGSDSSDSQSKDSSSSSSSLPGEEVSLFGNERKLKEIWMRYPGALACVSVKEAKSALVTAAGTGWAQDRASIPPIMTQYVRQTVMNGMSPAMAQEVLSVAQSIDLLLQAKPAACLDLLCQRLKSLESLGRGNHWSVGRMLELVRVEHTGLADDAEALSAARAAKEEEKLRHYVQRPYGSRWNDSQGGGKNKGGKDSKGKGRSDEHGKGKGDGKKEEGKGSWQKKGKQ